MLHMWGNDAVTARDRIYASGVAGGIGGCAGGFLRMNLSSVLGRLVILTYLCRGSEEYCTWCNNVCSSGGCWPDHIQHGRQSTQCVANVCLKNDRG